MIFVSSNKGKVLEIKDFFQKRGITVGHRDLDLTEIQGTPEQICIAKCREARRIIGGNAPILVEDTCLFFDAFPGLPGPYIKHFLDSMGTESLSRMLDNYQNKSGYGLCTLAFFPENAVDPILVNGYARGTITAPRGTRGFGWDSIFQPLGAYLTLAEMDPVEKSKWSPRTRALESFELYFGLKRRG